MYLPDGDGPVCRRNRQSVSAGICRNRIGPDRDYKD